MSETHPDHRFTIYRPHEVWRDAWVEHNGIGRVHYRLGAENGPGMLAYLLVKAGQPDGDVVMSERGRRVPLVQYFESLHRLAARREPSAVPPEPVIVALQKLRDGAEWSSITCQNDLLARDYVVIDDGKVVVSDSAATATRAKRGRRRA